MLIRFNIKNKIANVPDAVCFGCRQRYRDECRAYQVPHTHKEFLYRAKDIKPFCEMLVFKMKWNSEILAQKYYPPF